MEVNILIYKKKYCYYFYSNENKIRDIGANYLGLGLSKLIKLTLWLAWK